MTGRIRRCAARVASLARNRFRAKAAKAARVAPAALASGAIAVLLFLPVVLFCPRAGAPLSWSIDDSDGNLLGAAVARDGQWRLAGGRVPPRVAAALVAFEDRRFYLHPGVDPAAIARAALQNLGAGRVVSGGSTLTMQTARILDGNPARTFGQKLKEALRAALLEIRYSKRGILELYAANAPFGGNVVGMEAASWRYWNRPSETLTWAEAATLAVLPNQPALVHPGANRDRLRIKRDRLLNELAREGFIERSMLSLSLAEPLPDEPWPLPRLAPHYLERMKEAGVRKTHIDRGLQTTLSGILGRSSARFAESGINNAAGVIIETRTGKVLAWAGNTGADRQDARNADVDIAVSRRSSGSLLKPFLYGAMLDAGLILPRQLVIDIPTRIGSYKPENNLPVYQGVVRADEALSRSLNVPAIRELRDYGIAPFLTLLRESGFTTFDRTADEYGLPLILGGGELTLIETVRAYAALMNRAAGIPGRSGGPERTTDLLSGVPESPLTAGAAWLTLEALVNGERPEDEALWQSYASARKIAWKTGTSFGNRDAWAVGTTPRYTVGIWVGNATGEGRPELRSITTAAPVLFDVFSALPASGWIHRPEADLREVTVCADSGAPAGPDCARTGKQPAPAKAPPAPPCPWCRTVSLTPDGKFQATAGDLSRGWAGSLPLVRKQFVLPPGIEYWYQRHDLSYRSLPPWVSGHRGDSVKADLAIVFPEPGARVFIPVEITGSPGRLILEAAHRDGDAIVYWDIDGEYLGQTRNYHQLAVRPAPGTHTLTVTDNRGTRAVRTFEVLPEN